MNKHLLILSGPTHEYLDPVRFIGNASSGLMGKAIAEEAAARGYEVTFISGPVPAAHLPDLGSQGKMIHVTGAGEMLAAALHSFEESDAAVFAAAVADYAPVEMKPEKMAKSDDDLVIRLQATPDIAQTLCAGKRADQTAIGFALQTSCGEANARRKLETKNLDGIVLNTPATLGADSGTFSFLSRKTEAFEQWGTINKASCAEKILQALEKMTV